MPQPAYDALIAGGMLVTEAGTLRGDLAARGSRIVATPGSGHFIPTAGPHAPANGDPRRADT